MHYFFKKYCKLFICITFENSQFTLYFFPSNLDLDFLGLLVSVSGIKFNACLFRSMVDFVSSCHVLLLIVKTYFDERNFWVVIFRNDNVETATLFSWKLWHFLGQLFGCSLIYLKLYDLIGGLWMMSIVIRNI